MRKLWAFLLLGTFSLYVTTAEAKVCFLPNVLIGGKCVSLSKAKYNDCKGFTETTPCDEVGKETIETCTAGETTYYKCGCRGDVISWDVINEHPGWLCEKGYAQECGCSADHISCAYEYKYRGDGTGHCAKSDDNDNSTGVGACVLPNGRVYYKDCNCNAYPYECDGLTGLRAPTGAEGTIVGCKSPHSVNYKYKTCECAEGWISGSCENNTNGCLMPISYVTANDGELTCSLCDERLCKSSGESNLETIYCAAKRENGIYAHTGEYLSATVTDCVDLGFVQGATGGFCPAGTSRAGEEGVKCPFDGSYMFCEAQAGCYPSPEACESLNGVKTCQVINGCYRVFECNEGYELNQNAGICAVAKCAEGFTTEALDCDDAAHGIMHGYNGSTYWNEKLSGDKDCEQCECDIEAAREEGYCWYTKDPSDTDGIFAGEGTLSVPCCDGSYSECSFPFGTTTPSVGVATHEKHEACGKTYYVPTSCLEGYVLEDGNCEIVACANEYSTEFQSVKDCSNGSDLYKGATGWTMTPQTDSKGDVVRSDGKICNKCTCDTAGLDCEWSVSNKGRFGRLVEGTACCDGTYKSCVANLCASSGTDDMTEDSDASNDCIPSSASISLCSSVPAHAVNLKKYDACGQETRCLVKQCEQGYRPSDDGLSCVKLGTCESAGYTTDSHTGDASWSCTLKTVTETGQSCYKCSCASGYVPDGHEGCKKKCNENDGYYSRLSDCENALENTWAQDCKIVTISGNTCYTPSLKPCANRYPGSYDSREECEQGMGNGQICSKIGNSGYYGYYGSGSACYKRVCNTDLGYADDGHGGCEKKCNENDGYYANLLDCREALDNTETDECKVVTVSGNTCYTPSLKPCANRYPGSYDSREECEYGIESNQICREIASNGYYGYYGSGSGCYERFCNTGLGYMNNSNGACICNTSTYPYTAAPTNGRLTGTPCNDGVDHYPSFTCDLPYVKNGNTCQHVCEKNGYYVTTSACENSVDDTYFCRVTSVSGYACYAATPKNCGIRYPGSYDTLGQCETGIDNHQVCKDFYYNYYGVDTSCYSRKGCEDYPGSGDIVVNDVLIRNSGHYSSYNCAYYVPDNTCSHSNTNYVQEGGKTMTCYEIHYYSTSNNNSDGSGNGNGSGNNNGFGGNGQGGGSGGYYYNQYAYCRQQGTYCVITQYGLEAGYGSCQWFSAGGCQPVRMNGS